jgi:tetratricopeptide (TPR) repeat protein
MAQRKFDCFISYAQEDAPRVDRIAQVLTSAGLTMWYDQWSLIPGEQFSEAILGGIKASRTILVFIGKQALSRNQAYELGVWQGAHPNADAILVLLPGASGENLLPISNTRTVDFRQAPEEVAIGDLVEAAVGMRRGIIAAPSPLELDHDNIASDRDDEWKIRGAIERELSTGRETAALAAHFRNLGNHLRLERRFDEAIASYERALEILRAIGDTGSSHFASVLTDRGSVFRLMGHLDKAEHSFREAIHLQKSNPERDPAELGAALNNFGGVLQDTRRPDEAERAYREAAEIALEQFGSNDPRYAAALNNEAGVLASMLERQGEAEALYRRSLAILSDKFHSSLIATSVMTNLGQLLRDRGEFEEAEELTRRALEIAINSLGSLHPEVATSMLSLSIILGETGRGEEALRFAREATAILESTLGPNNAETAAALDQLARALLRLGHFSEATHVGKRALSITRKTMPKATSAIAIRLSTLAAISLKSGDIVGAERYSRQALRILERSFGAQDPMTLTARENLGVVKASLKAGS